MYYVELPSNRTEMWFALEADRMANPVFREFYTERDVVMEERRLRIETSPGGLLYENHLATALPCTPTACRWWATCPTWRTSRRQDVEEYYRRFYGPNNAVVAVVGDVDADRVLGWAAALLRSHSAGGSRPPVLARGAGAEGERRVVVEWDAEPFAAHRLARALRATTTRRPRSRCSRRSSRAAGPRASTGVSSRTTAWPRR